MAYADLLYALRGFRVRGSSRNRHQAESDLTSIIEAAEQAGIIWLMFDSEASVTPGLPVLTSGPEPG